MIDKLIDIPPPLKLEQFHATKKLISEIQKLQPIAQQYEADPNWLI